MSVLPSPASPTPTPDPTQWGGVYVAKVYSTSDPTGAQRIQMYIPQVFGSLPVKIWAPPVIPGGVVPNLGDIVWCLFQGGDPAYPTYLPKTASAAAGITEITSLDDSITVTDPTGPTANLSVNFPTPPPAPITDIISSDGSIKVTDGTGPTVDLSDRPTYPIFVAGQDVDFPWAKYQATGSDTTMMEDAVAEACDGLVQPYGAKVVIVGNVYCPTPPTLNGNGKDLIICGLNSGGPGQTGGSCFDSLTFGEGMILSGFGTNYTFYDLNLWSGLLSASSSAPPQAVLLRRCQTPTIATNFCHYADLTLEDCPLIGGFGDSTAATLDGNWDGNTAHNTKTFTMRRCFSDSDLILANFNGASIDRVVDCDFVNTFIVPLQIKSCNATRVLRNDVLAHSSGTSISIDSGCHNVKCKFNSVDGIVSNSGVSTTLFQNG